MKKFFCLSIFLLLIGCASNVIKEKKQIFKDLDKEKVYKKFDGFYISIPDSWFSYMGIHNLLTHSPKILKKNHSNVYNLIDVKAFSYVSNNKSLESIIDNQIKNLNKVYKKIKYSIHKMKHEEYGEYVIVKYASNFSNSSQHIDFIFLVKGIVYKISYSSVNEYYDKYISDFQKMIQTFKIII